MSQLPPTRQPEFLPKLVTTLTEGYSLTALGHDLLAGFAVAIVALPLSLAIAIASGAPPQVGLVTLIVGGFMISLFGGSRTQIGGPTAAFIVVVYSVVHAQGLDGLIMAGFMAGMIMVVAALLRVGALIRYVPEPVIRGFTVGIAVVIAASQLKDVLGLTGGDIPAEFFAKAAALWSIRSTFNISALFVALITLAIIIGFRRYQPKFPGIVVAVLVAAIIVPLFHLPVETIASRFGPLDFALPAPLLPDFTPARILELLPSALIIAFLASIESLLSAMVADKLSGGHHRPNGEMLAQGLANIAASLFGGLPATGAIARTATNIRAGGRTPVAGLSHALYVMIFMAVAAPLVGYLALPSLSAVLLVAAWTMSEPMHLRADLSVRFEDSAVLMLTLLLTVFADLTLAITLGTIAALLFRFRRRKIPPPDWHTPQT